MTNNPMFPGDDPHELDATGVVDWHAIAVEAPCPCRGPSNRPGVRLGDRIYSDRESKRCWLRERMRRGRRAYDA